MYSGDWFLHVYVIRTIGDQFETSCGIQREIDVLDLQQFQTFLTGFYGVVTTAVQKGKFVFHESEFRGEEDV